jgi:hypothetical protein
MTDDHNASHGNADPQVAARIVLNPLWCFVTTIWEVNAEARNDKEYNYGWWSDKT